MLHPLTSFHDAAGLDRDAGGTGREAGSGRVQECAAALQGPAQLLNQPVEQASSFAPAATGCLQKLVQALPWKGFLCRFLCCSANSFCCSTTHQPVFLCQKNPENPFLASKDSGAQKIGFGASLHTCALADERKKTAARTGRGRLGVLPTCKLARANAGGDGTLSQDSGCQSDMHKFPCAVRRLGWVGRAANRARGVARSAVSSSAASSSANNAATASAAAFLLMSAAITSATWATSRRNSCSLLVPGPKHSAPSRSNHSTGVCGPRFS